MNPNANLPNRHTRARQAAAPASARDAAAEALAAYLLFVGGYLTAVYIVDVRYSRRALGRMVPESAATGTPPRRCRQW